jgi:serine kinase of HPr protein (carbohydrate metabolism regulator)
LRLIDRGAVLISDDYCEIEKSDGGINLSAPAAIAGRLEVRGLGIMHFPCRSSARLGLIVELAANASIERMPDKTSEIFEGVAVRWVSVDPTHASSDAKVRLAVAELEGSRHG